MKCLFRCLLISLGLLALPVQAQSQSLFDPTAPANGAGGQEAVDALVEILRDDAAREVLIERLLTESEEVAAPENGDVVTLTEGGSLARQIAEYTRGLAEGTTAFLFELLGSLQGLAGLFAAGQDVNGAEFRAAAIALVLVAAVTLGLFFGLRAVGVRIFRAMSARAERRGWIYALTLILSSSVVDAAIILLAWGGGYAFALVYGVAGEMDVRQSLFLNAFLLIELTKVVLRAIFSPQFPRLRFATMSDETAAYWYFWSSRLVSLLGYGLLLVVPLVNASVSPVVGRSLAVMIALAALFVAVLIVLQNRAPIRRALSARSERDPQDLIGRIEAILGAFWHWLAIAYLVALFAIWMARPGEALQFMLVATVNSAVAVVVGVGVMALISRAIRGGLRLPADLQRNLPLLEARLNAFVPSVLKVVRALVILTVLIAIGQTWQVMDFVGWLASEVGRDLLGRLVSAALVVLITALIWLAVSSFIEYRLNPVVGTVPTARERTLLALFRNAFMIALVIIAAMLTLSELGVNIAPLLAGAGVLGLAIGFGAQKLVQDIITGAFIQFENAMNEGDVVTAGGTTGVVEKLTIRSVGLRDVSGTYHLIPFSSVDMVSNFMKGFAFHVAEIGVAYRENVSEVKALMHKAFDILQAGDLGDQILEPLDIQGVSALGDSAVVVRGRIKVKPGMQWAVGRAYNEIIKEVLDEAGVEIPFPHMTVYMGQDKDGSAPPLNLRRYKTLPPAAEASEPSVEEGGAENASDEAAASVPDEESGKPRRGSASDTAQETGAGKELSEREKIERNQPDSGEADR
ncbi:mechanosensitive ion channel domain-containing protein [Alkalilacustris brevis]|uniref:mechanosensitive ion channel domain-containing protein n=1 Tax=Alkalilacustris brevis TaxID=2026338 RepID=UPI00138FCC7A|nr:mechanosensitive ion channel domain-containing protein [Alkalilacustris brevis]